MRHGAGRRDAADDDDRPVLTHQRTKGADAEHDAREIDRQRLVPRLDRQALGWAIRRAQGNSRRGDQNVGRSDLLGEILEHGLVGDVAAMVDDAGQAAAALVQPMDRISALQKQARDGGADAAGSASHDGYGLRAHALPPLVRRNTGRTTSVPGAS